MTSTTTKAEAVHPQAGSTSYLFDDWFDPIEAGLRDRVRGFMPSPTGARVPRTQKRDVLEAILSAHGPLTILSIAEATSYMPPEPVVQALTLAPDAGDLLER